MKALLPSVFGVLMVAAVGYRADGPALVTAVAALVAVTVSVWWRPAAVVAVVLTVSAVVLAPSAPMSTALAGLAAAAYLVLRHNDRHGEARATPPTMVAAVAFALTATAVVALPVDIPWLPLAAPVALLVGYVLTLRPFSDFGVLGRAQHDPARRNP
ncbi:hypothetical protein [Mycolicibacterium monacense]|uniref:hypothetical protein n=1 Tax=Mycolicibacterium monacense TaxID=85693 RepID=UPI0007E946AC|nr:hypothetical protein [Mycolicibacterium monacense]MDA4104433.1 hypothetical protein [Mycolicibacterium monacense DSM 44395]OBB61609.1 hypothetical protein A6B34_02115 [Mycolicibacterium monacense]ORB24507.1 hypothetical protein BST34_00640 [Mycolicibacterium monacense DSM 44395]QHP84028.1 hypothetical protein EWR22_00880 [Mycolicibacterium monacense DSM 44395]